MSHTSAPVLGARAHRTLANLAGLIGAFAAGAIGEAFGLQAVFAVGAGIVLVSVLGRLILTEDRIRTAEAEAAQSSGETAIWSSAG